VERETAIQHEEGHRLLDSTTPPSFVLHNEISDKTRVRVNFVQVSEDAIHHLTSIISATSRATQKDEVGTEFYH